ncbi:MAG: hypothetical protein ACBR20_24720 [Microcoleus sp.]
MLSLARLPETIANPCNKRFAVNRWTMFGHGNRSIYNKEVSFENKLGE